MYRQQKAWAVCACAVCYCVVWYGGGDISDVSDDKLLLGYR